jgi:hypothetical protein
MEDFILSINQFVCTPVVYCATTMALVVLEVRVHIPLANFQPRARYAPTGAFWLTWTGVTC